jgi:hypothetical protein
MKDMLYQILIHGNAVIAWVGVALVALLARYVVAKIGNDLLRGCVGRALDEVRDAVAEVWQTYVSALKEANVDGKLTAEEKALARQKALAIVQGNLGTKGIARLGRILGIDSVNDWLATKIESAVDVSKKQGKLVEAPKAVPKAVPLPLP